MKGHLFLVFGASGSGKSTVLNTVLDLSPRITIHKKDSTRGRRPTEEGQEVKELDFKDNLNSSEYVLTYEYCGNQYGVKQDQIDKAKAEESLHFLILADIDAVKEMKQKYPDSSAIYVHYAPEQIPRRFQERDPREIGERMAIILKQYNDYIENNTLFDHVVIGIFDPKNAATQLTNILRLYDSSIQKKWA